MKNITCTLVMLSILWGTGCVHIKNIQRETLEPLDETGTKTINGRYQNSIPDTAKKYRHSLWAELTGKQKDKYAWIGSSTITLEAISSHQLKATLWNDSIAVKSKTLKGKYSGGYFYVNRHFKFVPLPFIFFKKDDHKIRVGKLKNGQLVMDVASSGFLWILFFAGGYDDQFDLKFELVR
jgi:hypothetical protein